MALQATRIGYNVVEDEEPAAAAPPVPCYAAVNVPPSAVIEAPKHMWPVVLPSRVVEVRNSSWGCAAFWLILEMFVMVTSPGSWVQHWLSPNRLFGRGGFCLLLHGALLLWAARLMRSCANDPGFLQPGSGKFEEPLTTALESPNNNGGTFEGELEEIPLHWCRDCSLLQPRRTKHCRECGLCVRTFDHHCFWIGGCVGEFNHRRFYLMLAVWTVVLTSHLALVSTCVGSPWLAWLLSGTLQVFLLQMILGGFLLTVGGLLVYHSYLVATAQTTWEHLSRWRIEYMRHFPREVFPFSVGLLENVRRFFLEPSTAVNPRDWTFTWGPGEPVPFNLFENKWWSCC